MHHLPYGTRPYGILTIIGAIIGPLQDGYQGRALKAQVESCQCKSEVGSKRLKADAGPKAVSWQLNAVGLSLRMWCQYNYSLSES